jgi:hypothetical protein
VPGAGAPLDDRRQREDPHDPRRDQGARDGERLGRPRLGTGQVTDQGRQLQADKAAFTASTVLLGSFVIIEHRTARPLLPLRIVADRSRGGAYASMAIVGAALFSVFLFMTFYMQQILRFSPVKTGLRFLPLTGAVIIVALLVQTRILPCLGPRAVIVTGMILGVIAMIIFTRLTPGGSYATHVLPGLIRPAPERPASFPLRSPPAPSASGAPTPAWLRP